MLRRKPLDTLLFLGEDVFAEHSGERSAALRISAWVIGGKAASRVALN
jgi:hypothetical protein